jgi:ABC-type Fe3+ transport system substrate-binding protein
LYKITKILLALMLSFSMVVSLTAIVPVTGQIGEVVVLTPHYSFIYDVYVDAFEAMYPEINVEIKAMSTPLCYAHLVETKDNPDTDVWWGGGLDWIAKASDAGLLAQYTLQPETEANITSELFGLPLKDPDKYFYGSALSGFGIMYNTEYLSDHALPVPMNWEDLADHVYSGHISMARPSRSGSTHMIVEIILQGFGWDAGWELLMQIGANCGEFTEKSGYVPDHVQVGEYGIGLVIDFYGFLSNAEGYPTEFFYPINQTVINPDSIAKVANGPNPSNADLFIDFVLSPDGQKLLFNPSILRMPVREDVYEEAPEGYFNPFETTMTVVEYNSTIGEMRTTLIDALFDSIITYRHTELMTAWKQIWAIEEQIEIAEGTVDVSAATATLNEAIQLAATPPVSALTSVNATFNEQFETDETFASEQEALWDTYATTNYDNAYDKASEAYAEIFEKLPIISQLNTEISALTSEIEGLRSILYAAIGIAIIALIVGAIGIFRKTS